MDDFRAISAEVLAQFPEMIVCKEEVEFSEKPIMELKGLKGLVFLRKGEIFEE